MAEFADWDSFYVIVGSAAGALIGLQFVVMTLIAEKPPKDAQAASAAFATPTVVHFAVAFLLSALVRVPWPSVAVASVPWGCVGLVGVAYTGIVVRRMRRQNAYRPEFEDWLFHGLLPLLSYAVLTASSILAPAHTREALFGIGGAALLLLFVGIHNAWDAVAYHVFVTRRRDEERRSGGA